MPLTPGTRLGTHEIVGPLGSGGMGEVYRARDLRLGREVALKVLPAEVESHPDRLLRLEREARTVAGLNHPNIVVIHSVEDEGGTRFLTMELVEGERLDAHVVPGGVPVSLVVEVGIALADALTAAHEKGVVHRDLKPANVMLTKDGRVKVLDFGLAKLTDEDANWELDETQAMTMDSQASMAGQMLGTLPYMSPEQIRGGRVDARTDLFSLGIILYELAAGHKPFTGATPPDVSSAILRDTPEPLSRLRPDMPADLDRIVSRLLEKNPRERFQTALDVCNELRGLRRTMKHGRPERVSSGHVASIAVIPFVNRSHDADDEYFSDGLADEMLSVLAKIKGLRVSARSSAFSFKGKSATIAEIGRTLNVATVLEGTVRKAGNRVRISVQLVKVSDGYHLWSETYDRTLDDIFAVQDDIARSVVKELRTALLGEVADSQASGEAKADVARAARGRTSDPEAHRLYLLARYLFDRVTREDLAKAREYLKQAIDRDPEFALAWAELGSTHAVEANLGFAPLAEGYRKAREVVERSLSLEPELAEGHAEKGWIQMLYDRDWRGAEASFRRALALAPGSAVALRRAGVLARAQGYLDEAIDLYRRALEQDPLSTGAYHNLGYALQAADRFVESEAAYRKLLELAPLRTGTRAHLALSVLAQGRDEEALGEALGEPEEWLRLYALAIVHRAMGRGEESDRELRELSERYAEEATYQIAEVHVVRGDADAAFQWLERAFDLRDGGLIDMKVSPRLRPLHGDPRWAAFLKKMGLAEEMPLIGSRTK